MRKMLADIPDELVHLDLEKFRQLAIDLGATGAKVVTTHMVIIDDRVRAKGDYPKCHWYGTNWQCPPYAPDLDEVRRIVKNHRYAVFT